jgi:hypothetical protein
MADTDDLCTFRTAFGCVKSSSPLPTFGLVENVSHPTVPGLSEYDDTKSWSGSPMAGLQRAVIMLRKLNLRGIPREIRNALRDLQDIYSESINLVDDADSSDEETDVELGDEGGNSHEAERENTPREEGQSTTSKIAATHHRPALEIKVWTWVEWWMKRLVIR